MIPTAAQITKLRSHPQATKLYLSIYQPTTILACRVNDLSIVKGTRSITYDGVTAGSYLLVQAGMTLKVGTALGGFDKGIVRVKSATSSVITVAENSHINWADNDYLTIENFYEINAVFPRIIQSPSNPEQTIWYKDYDVAYTNQNDILGSFICMGSHYAGFVGDQVYYSASGTFNLLSDTLSYHWFFEGATVTGSSVNTPGYISYGTPGYYTARLIVSGSSTGAVDVSYRHVSIYNRPESGTNVPILSWELASLSGSREQGGYTADIRILQSIPEGTLREGSLVVIFADDWYSDLATRQSIGGNALNRSSIVFSGYILNGSLKYNYRDSTAEFKVGNPNEVMKMSEGFAVSVQSSTNPTNEPIVNQDIPSSWVAVLNMDIRRAIYHYLRWHSTVLSCCDFHFKGTDRPIQYFDSDRTSLYDAIDTLMKGTFTGKLVSDRQGALWAERDIYVEPSSFDTSFELDKRDWVGDIGIEETPTDQVSFIEIGGVAFSGSTGTFSPYMSAIPGTTPGYRGKLERTQGLALLSQSELNSIGGSVWAQKNKKYTASINSAGNYRNFDIAPQERIPLTVSSSDTIRGITLTQQGFFIDRMDWKYDPRTELFAPDMSLEELTTGFSGDSIPIPATPDDDGTGFFVPPIVFPPIHFPPFPVVDMGGTGTSNGWIPYMGHYYPATFGWNGTSSTFIAFDYTNGGIPLAATDNCTAYARYENWAGYGGVIVEVYALFRTLIRDGNVKIFVGVHQNSIYDLTAGVSRGTISNYDSPYEIHTLIGLGPVFVVGPYTVTLSNYSIIDLVFQRAGADAADTNSGGSIFYGWFVKPTI